MKTNQSKGSASRRLFFALWPTDAVRRMLAGVADSLTCEGTSVPKRNFHVTLAFLGSVDAARQRCLAEMAAGIEVRPFVLRLDSVGCFLRAGIVWSGASRAPPGLISLVGKLNRGLTECGFTPEGRPFQAHVTLFRKADLRNNPAGSERRSHDPIEWLISDFCLVESSTLPTGARYRVLDRWPLRGDGS
uniref:RNA 2',3'-cyclic phosphodiesterase n=1 Tax=Candidatus Kentrum sp. SD TaxID=2126332 RepID=A0A451BKQ8_9GAMM|nr:MAG: 2'-5' RNA ligase [Candidatus Kentron sp. SD]VFK39731.1 MAG: 2'-5' RNA ligase [Candidatus Kentron sp. SD]VFK78798.1 MAG: 2'-5' RNA ligase [Candidatus Kentron sp. SD]